MTDPHDKPGKRLGEPVQVYLDRAKSRKLDQLAGELGLSKSGVMRRGLEALERQISDPAEHPAPRIIGIASAEQTKATRYDVAREHDRYLADSEEKSWKPGRKRKYVAVMSDRGVREALALDHHFGVAGFAVKP